MGKIKYIGLLLIVAVLVSCSIKPKSVYTDELENGCRVYDYYVDAHGNEGIVAAIFQPIDNDGVCILVISLDEASLRWGPMGEKVYQENTYVYGLSTASFGIAMLQSMKSRGISRYPAQEWCDQKNKDEAYVRGGSWHLPTVYEYERIFGEGGYKVDSLNAALLKAGGVPISTSYMYWTCVEDIEKAWSFENIKNTYDPENRAVPMDYQIRSFTNRDHWLKKNWYNVRAVKYIYYEYKKDKK